MKTRYTNAVAHLKRCYNEDELVDLVRAQWAAEVSGDDSKVHAVQQQLFTAMATPKDRALDAMTRLIVHHNVPAAKFRDEDFVDMLKFDAASYDTWIGMAIELMFLVEQKISDEVRGGRGCAIHDAWSKYGRHYVALLVCYLCKKGKGKDGKPILEKVIRLLSCAPLPHDDALDEDGSKLCLSGFSTLFDMLS